MKEERGFHIFRPNLTSMGWKTVVLTVLLSLSLILGSFSLWSVKTSKSENPASVKHALWVPPTLSATTSSLFSLSSGSVSQYSHPDASKQTIGLWAWNRYLRDISAEPSMLRKSSYCIRWSNDVQGEKNPLAEELGVNCVQSVGDNITVQFESGYFKAPYQQNQVTLIVVVKECSSVDAGRILERWDGAIVFVSIPQCVSDFKGLSGVRQEQSILVVSIPEFSKEEDKSEVSVSYAAMVNIGVNLAKSRFVLLLEPNVIPSSNLPSYIERSVTSEFEKKNIVVLVPSVSSCSSDSAFLPNSLKELKTVKRACGRQNISTSFFLQSDFEQWMEFSSISSNLMFPQGGSTFFEHGSFLFSKISLDGTLIHFNEALTGYPCFNSYFKLAMNVSNVILGVVPGLFTAQITEQNRLSYVKISMHSLDYLFLESHNQWKYAQEKRSQTSHIKQSYCLRWCPIDFEVDDRNLYPEQSKSSSSVELVYEADFQHKGKTRLAAKCCHFITQDSLDVLYDSRRIDSEDSSDVTLVTFGSYDRVESFMEMARRWKGPSVVLFYCVDYNDHITNEPCTAQQALLAEKLLLERPSNSLVVAYIAKKDVDSSTLSEFNSFIYRSKKKFYTLPYLPINSFRNIVLDLARTRFVLPIDIDLAPDVALRSALRRLIPELSLREKVAWIVPHFEHRRCKNESLNLLPEVAQELASQITKGRIRPFHAELLYLKLKTSDSNFDEDCPKIEREIWPDLVGAQKLTRYRHWIEVACNMTEKESSTFYSVDRERVRSPEDRILWEPYVLIDRANNIGPLIRYNELFVGRFFNKVAFITSLRDLGYEFEVIYDHFLIHQKHEQSPYAQNLDHLFDPMLELLHALGDEIRADPLRNRQNKFWSRTKLSGRFLPQEVDAYFNSNAMTFFAVIGIVGYVSFSQFSKRFTVQRVERKKER
jgi:uncharacterized protein YlbG (UPF0298 family)